MDAFRFIHDERRFRIGTSIGLVPVDDRWATPETILQAADTACYAAKEAGRNRVHVWFDTDTVMRARHREMQWTIRIERALDEDRFVLFAQRIVALDDEPHGVHTEVLLRMEDGGDVLVQPGTFLPAAERFHLASRMHRWVLKHAIAWIAAAPSLDFLEILSVILAGQSVGDRAFHRWAIEVLSAANEAICRNLCFEITETAAVMNLADAALYFQKIRAMGIDYAEGFLLHKPEPIDGLLTAHVH